MLLFLIIIFIVLIVLSFLFYASYSIRSGVYLNVLSGNKKKGKVIALTFDDGPNAIQTPKILDILKEHDAKACFFCIGSRIDGNEDVLKRIDHEGHFIGNHSYYHSNSFPLQSVNKITNELVRCDEKITGVTGKKTQLFRPPFGVTNPMIAKAVKRQKLITIGWNIRSLDTLEKGHDVVLKRIRRKLKPGSILLLHDHVTESDVLLRQILDLLKEENYTVVTLDQLLDIKPYL